MLDINKLSQIMQLAKDDVDLASKVSDQIVFENTSDLDSIMQNIRKDIINSNNQDDYLIESYLLQLTNSLYFVSSRVERFGFYEDITKANARLAYNKAYSENQLLHANDAKKPTQSDNQLAAEMNSVDESTLNMIYSRSVKIIDSKVESANEMVRTLSKILSVHMNTNSVTKSVRKSFE